MNSSGYSETLQALEAKLKSHGEMESRYGRLYVHSESVQTNSAHQAQCIANEIKVNNIDKSVLDKYKHFHIVKQICVYL